MTVRLDGALEQLLRRHASESPQRFPNRDTDYSRMYAGIKEALKKQYYDVAGAGLARGGGRFTRHDIGHVDDVIQVAGEMLGLGTSSGRVAADELEPYEVFVLLLAILLHDAGNAVQREGHEREPRRILDELGDLVALPDLEKRLVSSIARAHGGATPDGDKDTIGRGISPPVAPIGSVRVHARRLAALLRLADELSERPSRADQQALRHPHQAEESLLPNLYCQVIHPVVVDPAGRTISITFDLRKAHLNEEYVLVERGEGHPVLLVDYIARRLDKCERERQYCNRFLADFAPYDSLRVLLEVWDEDGDTLLERIPLTLADEGYPRHSTTVAEVSREFDGLTLRRKHFPAPQHHGEGSR